MRRIPTGLRGLVIAVLTVAAACSSSRSQENVSSTSQAVVSSNTARALSFEQPTTDWTASGLNLQQGNLFVDGQHSAEVTIVNNGGMLTSVPLSSLGPISSTVTLQVRLPAYVASTTWQGQVALHLNSPTAGVFTQYFGPAAFSNSSTGVFHQVQFTLPPAIQSALSTATYNDLTVGIELDFGPNPNPNAGFSDPFYIDKLDFGQVAPPDAGAGGTSSAGTGGKAGAGGGTGAGGTTAGAGGAGAGGTAGTSTAGAGGTAGTAGTAGAAGTAGIAGTAGTAGTAGSGTSGPCSFTAAASGSATDVPFVIKLPVGVHREEIGVGTTGGYLTLDDGVTVVKDAGGFASVSSVSATNRTNLGVAAEVQDVYTEATGIDLRSNAHVHGTLKTAADFTAQAGAVVDGNTLQNTSLQPLESITWTASFPNTNQGSCSLEPDNTEVIDPGSYGDIAVKSRSHLKIRSGTYYFNSLSFEPQAELDIANTAGPVFIYIRTTFAFSGTVVETDTTHMNFLFGVAGSSGVNIQTAFRGILIAPNAGVSLPTDSNVGHVGAFFANAFIAHQNTALHQRPFSPTEFCASDAACSSFCPCGDNDVCGGTPTSPEPATADPNCIDGVCCPAGASVITLTPGADTFNNSTASACLVALAGNDTLFSAAPGVTVVGGTGDDTIAAGQFSPPGTGAPPVRIFGGPGNDTINGWFDGAQIYGGSGDDTISAGPGPVLIAPGSGVDNVSSGDGDDTFVLYSECEATPGKKLIANGGFNTLISPLSIAELTARGVTVQGFENVVIKSDACKSDCTPKPICGAGSQCADRNGVAVCTGGVGVSCQTCSDCASGLSCTSGVCTDPCTANPTAAGCNGARPDHCSDGVHDGDESDVDCGGSCAPCPSASGCGTDADCGTGMVCGQSNGACFGHARAERVCWPATCQQEGTAVGGCGDADSPCGQNCACVNGCDASAVTNACAPGEVCQKGLGRIFQASTPDVCTDPRCPSNDPSLCGSAASVCGATCVCTADCSHATCQNPSDGCGGTCMNVCNTGQMGCLDDLNCQSGFACIGGTCLPASCAFRIVAPPLCGTSGALCGDTCPACTPSCENRQCGADPVCGQSCGTCAAGSYCGFDGQCVAPTIETAPTVPDGNGGQKPLPALPPSPTTPVGALKGQFSVTDAGSAQYTIPIEVPPGRAGVEPALSLIYSGSRVNQEVGVGWHLDGLSKITRCPRSFAIDGYSAPIRNDFSDLFCIDGKRLDAISGTYGVDGTEYRTMIDSFAKVISHVDGGDGIQHAPVVLVQEIPRSLQGPDWFQVFTKDGHILTFGHTADSLVYGQNGVRYSWLLNRVEDRAGNTMLVGYTNVPGNPTVALSSGQPDVVRPLTVSYTGHGVSPGNRLVQFDYETRDDPQIAFLQGGVSFFSPDRLSRIRTSVNGTPVKNYHLQYAPGTVSQVAQISECAGADDTTCKAPTKFQYAEDHGFSTPFGLGLNFASAGQLDADGDGIPDFLTTTVKVGDVPANAALQAAQVSSDVGVGVASAFLTPAAGIAVNLIWDVIQGPFFGLFADQPPITTSNQLAYGSRDRSNPLFFTGDLSGVRCDPRNNPIFLLDYDQDGRDDIVSGCGFHNATLQVALSGASRGQLLKFPANGNPVLAASGTQPTLTLPAPIILDINGDGLQDVLTCEDPFTLDLWLRQLPPAGSNLQHMAQGFSTTAIQLKAPPAPPNTSGTHEAPPQQVPLALCDSANPTYKAFDVDGDGTLDLLARGQGGWQVLRYTVNNAQGSISFDPVTFLDVGGSKGSAGGDLFLGDFNGDGLEDIRHRNDNRTYTIWLNAGGGLFTARTVSEGSTTATGFDIREKLRATVTLDYNADGRSDLLENFNFDDNVDGEIIPHNFNTALLPDSIVSTLSGVGIPEVKFTAEEGGTFAASFIGAADLDGDGNPDLFDVDSNGFGGSVYYGGGNHNTLLAQVVDGLGNITRVNYDETGTYSGDTCLGIWPEKCLRTANNLVSSHVEGFTSSQGSEVDERTYTYHYVNGRMSVAGQGWLGFERRTVDMSAAAGEVITTTDYAPVARYDLSGNPTQTATPPYIYPFAGLVQTTTVDVLSDSGPGTIKPPLQRDFFDQRTQTVNTWAVQLSASNRPFPFVQTRTRNTYERPVTGGGFINPTRPPFEDNGSQVTTCLDSFSVDGYGNMLNGGSQCQGIESFLDEDSTVSTFVPDPTTWLISNPTNVQIFNQHVEVVEGSIRTAFDVREFNLGYTAQGLLHTVSRAPNGTSDQQITTTYDRDGFGNVSQITEQVPGEATRITGISYDSDNVFPHTITNPEQQTTQVLFDPNWGQPATVVDPNGIAVQMSYDGFGREGQTTGPSETAITTYSAIATPNTVTAIGSIEPRIQVTVDRRSVSGALREGSSTTEYDHYGRAVRQESEEFGGTQVIQEQAFDTLGRSLGRTLPHTAATTPVPFDSYSYDALHRLARINHSDGTYKEFQYATSASIDPTRSQWTFGISCAFGPLSDCAVNYMLTKDEQGRQNATVSDFKGRTVQTIDGNNVDNTSQVSHYVYGTFDTLVEAHDNRDLVTSFKYDPYGRRLNQSDIEGGIRIYTYNGFDELRTSNDLKSQLRTYNHDSLGRLESVVDPAGTTQWIFDQGVNALGRLSESISPPTPENPAGQQISYTYEPPTPGGNRGLLQSTTYSIDGTNYLLSFEYDDLGRTQRIHYPITGNGQPIVAQYTYDNSGVLDGLDEVGSGTTKSVWHLDDTFQGQFIQDETFGNGAKTTYGYNPARYWLENIQTLLGTEQIQSLTYTHYANGQVNTLTGQAPSQLQYVYDNLNRLSAVNTVSTTNPTSVSYSYDDIDNLINRAGTLTVYNPSHPHQIATVGANSYGYDFNGNVATRSGPDIPGGSQTFNYTPFDLPSSITNPSTATTVTLDYSADQERVVRRDPESFLHFASDLYQRKLDTFGNTLDERFRLYAGDRQLGEIDRQDGTDNTLYFHTDHLGSTTTISESDGRVTGQSFDPFGSPIDPLNPAITRVGFTGQDQDVDLGLTDMKGRIYDPLGGRFTGVDPVMQAPFSSQGLNRYSYVFNDPINNTDPSGFSANGEDSTVGIAGWGAGVVAGAAITAFSPSFGSALVGAAGSGANPAAGFLGGGLAGDARAGGSYSVTPTAAPKASGGSPGGAGALGQSGPSNFLNAQPRGIGADPNAAPPNGPMDPRLGHFSPISETPVDNVFRHYGEDFGCVLGECKSLLDTTLAAVRIFSLDEIRAASAVLQLIEVARLDALARVQAQYTDKVGKIAQGASKDLGRRVTPKEIEGAIHGVKENLGRGGPVRNPDVLVDPGTGDVRPKAPGGMGSSIGNIYDYL